MQNSKFKSFHFILALSTFYFSFFTFAQSANAHVLKTDGSIGAVLHVSPEDDPIAGESTDFFFELKDKDGKFKPENCECTGIIIADGKQIYSVPLFQKENPTLENASFSYILPEKNIYKVKISGKPITSGSFGPFDLEWDVRVSRTEGGSKNGSSNIKNESASNWISTHVIHLILIVSATFFMIWVIVNSKKKSN